MVLGDIYFVRELRKLGLVLLLGDLLLRMLYEWRLLLRRTELVVGWDVLNLYTVLTASGLVSGLECGLKGIKILVLEL